MDRHEIFFEASTDMAEESETWLDPHRTRIVSSCLAFDPEGTDGLLDT